MRRFPMVRPIAICPAPVRRAAARASLSAALAIIATGPISLPAAEPPGSRLPAPAEHPQKPEKKSFFSGLKKIFSSDNDAPSARPRGEAARPRDPAGTAARNPAPAAASAARDAASAARDAASAAPLGEASGTPRVLPEEAHGIEVGGRLNKYVITEDDVRFYKDGPLQFSPPDARLDTGTIVTVVKMRRGWTDVLLEDLTFGTVATEVLRKALASDFPIEPLEIGDAEGTAVASRGGGGGGRVIDNAPRIPLVPPPLPEAGSDEDGGFLLDNPLLLPPLPVEE